jgi:hypothetical protein
MNRTYGVEVKIRGALPSKDAALGWIKKRKREVVESPNRHLVSATLKEKPATKWGSRRGA